MPHVYSRVVHVFRIAELVTRVANAERDKETAQNYYRQCRLKIENLENELRALKAACHSTSTPPAAAGPAIDRASTKIFVGKLSPVVTEDALRQYCSKFGRVINVDIIRNTAHVLNYGFVHFSTREEAHKALSCSVHNIDCWEFIVAPARR